jgi:hypothetical protein
MPIPWDSSSSPMPLALTIAALCQVYRVILDFSSVAVGFAATLTVSRLQTLWSG